MHPIAGAVLIALLLALPGPVCSADSLAEKIKKEQQVLEQKGVPVRA